MEIINIIFSLCFLPPCTWSPPNTRRDHRSKTNLDRLLLPTLTLRVLARQKLTLKVLTKKYPLSLIVTVSNNESRDQCYKISHEGTTVLKTTKPIYGQTFCDLQTLLHTFFGFPGACCKVNILIFWMEGWTFVGI